MAKTAKCIFQLEKTERESIIPLPTAYLCENGFSAMLHTKKKKNDEKENRIEPRS